MNRIFALIFAVSLAGCATTDSAGNNSGSLFPSDAEHEAVARTQVKARTDFDLDCKDVEIVRLGDVNRLGGQMTEMTFGAKGCGKKATYVTECVSNWGKITCTPKLNSKE